jgi:hypothetical protein
MFKPYSIVEETPEETTYEFKTIYLWILYGILIVGMIGLVLRITTLTTVGDVRQPTARTVPIGNETRVGSELLWKTVRSDGGLAFPIFVRTPQDTGHPHPVLSPANQSAYPASFSHAKLQRG